MSSVALAFVCKPSSLQGISKRKSGKSKPVLEIYFYRVSLHYIHRHGP